MAAPHTKIKLLPGKATPAPPVGSVLGQRGVKLMDFCKEFNALTDTNIPALKPFLIKDLSGNQIFDLEPLGNLDRDLPVIIKINIKPDKSYEMHIKRPCVSELIKKNINIKSGSKTPGKDIIASISMAAVSEIAAYKMRDMDTNTLESAISSVIGSARSMGIKISD